MFWAVFKKEELKKRKNLRTRITTAGPYDVHALIPLANRGIVIGAITNAPENIMRGYLDSIRFYTKDNVYRPQGFSFDYALSAWRSEITSRMPKPNPGLLRYAIYDMQKQGIIDSSWSYGDVMSKTTYWGDEKNDLIFGINAGVAVAGLLDRAGKHPKGFPDLPPHLVFNNYEQIKEVMLNYIK